MVYERHQNPRDQITALIFNHEPDCVISNNTIHFHSYSSTPLAKLEHMMTSEPDYDVHLSQPEFLLFFQKWQIRQVFPFLRNIQLVPTDGVQTLIKSSLGPLTSGSGYLYLCSFMAKEPTVGFGQKDTEPSQTLSLYLRNNGASPKSPINLKCYKLFT